MVTTMLIQMPRKCIVFLGSWSWALWKAEPHQDEQLSWDSGPSHIPEGCNEEGAGCKEKEGCVQL
jgi:hypothetical protein